MTIEDPIEFVHQHKKCLVNQREVFSDTHSFKNALKYILRQDPDVVLVGEMRDLETISAALTIAETGHLTLGTLHTNSCAQTINRIIDVFPHEPAGAGARPALPRARGRALASSSFRRADGRGRAMALEIMVATPAIRNLIREEKIHQIYSAMQAGQKFGMQTMNQSLAELVQKRRISREEALQPQHAARGARPAARSAPAAASPPLPAPAPRPPARRRSFGRR